MKRVTLYTKAGCTTCIKARQFLLGQGIHYTERDIFKHPLNADEIKQLAGDRPLKDLFSTRSPSVKALGLANRELSDDELLQYMIQEPRLIRRPLLTSTAGMAIGFSPEAVMAVLSN